MNKTHGGKWIVTNSAAVFGAHNLVTWKLALVGWLVVLYVGLFALEVCEAQR